MNKLQKLKQGLKAIGQFLEEQQKASKGLKMISNEGSFIITLGNKFLDEYINLLEELIGDESSWVSWFVFDNDFGRRGLKAATKKTKYRIIDTPVKLLKLIEDSK